MNEDTLDIPLSEMLRALRRELLISQEQSVDERILFDIEKVELELKVDIARTAQGEAGIAFHVVKIGGGLEQTDTRSHTFTLTLTPVSSDSGDRVKVGAVTSDAASEE